MHLAVTASSDALTMAHEAPRTYTFSITVIVEPDDEAYDDPEWLADAAAGALANVYGYDCFFHDVAAWADGPTASGSINSE